MLNLYLPESERYDEDTNTFHSIKEKSFRLMHSLISISKWESIFHKPFIQTMTEGTLSSNELRAYIGCMIIGSYDQIDIDHIWHLHADKIKNHIESPETATIVTRNNNSKPNREVITSEIIYFWMIHYNIPHVYDKWHINRLLTLIDVCNVKQSKPKKKSKKEILSRNAQLNAQRRAALGTSG